VKKFVYLLTGLAVPLAIYWLYYTTDFVRMAKGRRERLQELQEIAVEDSFPASDPPANW